MSDSVLQTWTKGWRQIRKIGFSMDWTVLVLMIYFDVIPKIVEI